jgi:hypothetical protein
MEFTFTPNPEDQCFDLRIKRGDRTEAHQVATRDLFEWFRQLMVEQDCAITVSTDLVPVDTPTPRYLHREAA